MKNKSESKRPSFLLLRHRSPRPCVYHFRQNCPQGPQPFSPEARLCSPRTPSQGDALATGYRHAPASACWAHKRSTSHWGASSRPPQPEEVRPSQGLLGSAGECGHVCFCHPVPLPLLCFCHPPPLLPTLTQPVLSTPTQLTLLFPSTGPDHSRHDSRRLGPTL